MQDLLLVLLRQYILLRSTMAVRIPYGLGRVSEGTEYPQLAFANAIALIIIIAILYSTRPAVAKKTTPQ
jgi:hypothetical protein